MSCCGTSSTRHGVEAGCILQYSWRSSSSPPHDGMIARNAHPQALSTSGSVMRETMPSEPEVPRHRRGGTVWYPSARLERATECSLIHLFIDSMIMVIAHSIAAGHRRRSVAFSTTKRSAAAGAFSFRSAFSFDPGNTSARDLAATRHDSDNARHRRDDRSACIAAVGIRQRYSHRIAGDPPIGWPIPSTAHHRRNRQQTRTSARLRRHLKR